MLLAAAAASALVHPLCVPQRVRHACMLHRPGGPRPGGGACTGKHTYALVGWLGWLGSCSPPPPHTHTSAGSFRVCPQLALCCVVLWRLWGRSARRAGGRWGLAWPRSCCCCSCSGLMHACVRAHAPHGQALTARCAVLAVLGLPRPAPARLYIMMGVRVVLAAVVQARGSGYTVYVHVCIMYIPVGAARPHQVGRHPGRRPFRFLHFLAMVAPPA